MWYIYILECKGGCLYTGITNSLQKRLAAHKSGKGAKYTKAHPPLRIIYTEELPDKNSALKRELQIKKLKHSEKLKLANKDTPDMPETDKY